MPAEPAPQLAQVTPDDVESNFRASIEDVVVVLERLSPHFDQVEDLIESLKLALDNPGHLRFLLNKVSRRAKR